MPTPADSAAARPIPAALRSIFFLSGGSALIDQIVWTRATYRIFGVTAPATATVLTAFMAGLAIGSYLFGRLADRLAGRQSEAGVAVGRSRRSEPTLRLYAAMEAAIAIFAPLTPWVFKRLEPVYVSLATATGLDSPWLPVLRAALCTLVLLPPTVLMGGTLPVLAKSYLRGRPGRATAMLYSINTWGAVFGCFLAGYVLLGELGEQRSLLVAAGGNLLAAAWAFFVARGGRGERVEAGGTVKPPDATRHRIVSPVATVEPGSVAGYATRVVFVASFVNGTGALALEVLWGRLAALFTDASVYAYSCIIGVFLIGIAAGSRLAGIFVDGLRRPHAMLGVLIIAMGLCVAACVRLFVSATPVSALGGIMFMDYAHAVWFPVRTLGLAAVLIAPVTLLSGACFPLLVRIAAGGAGHESRRLGAVYSINTLGGIVGAVGAGFVLLPLLGDRASFFAIAVLYIVSGAACLLTTDHAAERTRGIRIAPAITTVSLAVLVLLLPPSGSLSREVISGAGAIAQHVESPTGTVTAMTRRNGERHLLVNGTGMTILCTDTKLMAHLPLALHPNPQSVLVICFGMGTCFRSAAVYPVDVTAVELQPAVPRMFDYFHVDAAQVLASPRQRIVIADGRNFLLTSRARWSVITIDPAPPMYSTGTVNLYTREFFALCRDHLDEHGNTCLWIPDNCSLESDVRLILRTFRSVFSDVQVWRGPDMLGIYLIGAMRPLELRDERVHYAATLPRAIADLCEYRSVMREEWPRVAQWRLLDAAGVDRYCAAEARLLTDDRPYTEFPWLSWIRLGPDLPSAWMSLERFANRSAAPTLVR